MKEEKRSQQSETAKLYEQWRLMFDHLIVHSQRVPQKSPQFLDAETKRCGFIISEMFLCNALHASQFVHDD